MSFSYNQNKMAFETCTKILSENFDGDISEFLVSCPYADIMAGGFIGAMITLGIFVILLFVLAFYIYTSLAWYTIGKKLKYKNSWLAWIPIARWAMILQLGRFHWAWIFLILIPIFGWIALFVILIISKWHIYEKRKYPGWFSLSLIIPQIGVILELIAIGFVAWKDIKRKLF